MRKKYLSALLFGALLVTSTGTFTSCKDYDDDINNLQEQITANADAIKALEELVKAGKYVSGVAIEGQVITFTFSDGSTTPITIPEGEKGQTVEVKDNELYIDGEATGIKVAEAATAETGLVKAENGTWWVLGEDGEYTNTNIPVSGVTVSGSEAEGYTFTIYTNGSAEPQVVKLPSASSSLVDIILVDTNNSNTNGTGDVTDGSALQYQNVTLLQFRDFEYKNGNATKPNKWPGKALPSNGQVIIAQQSPLLVQLNPTNVDGKDVKFSLIDSKKAAAGVDLVATDYTDILLARAANENGLYNLAMEDIVVNNSTAATNYFSNFEKDNDQKRYAITAGSVLSEYNVLCAKGTPTINYGFDVKDASGDKVNNANTLNLTVGSQSVIAPINDRLEMGQWYTVDADMATIYDLYLSASQDEITLYGIEIKNNEDGVYQFRYTKTPDNVSKPEIHLTIQSVDKEGEYNSTTATFSLSEVISSAYTYAETAWTLVDYHVTSSDNSYKTKNAFSVKMEDMLNSFSAENLALWNTKVQKVTVQLYDVETGKVAKDKSGATINGLPDGMHVAFMDKDGNDLFDVETNSYSGGALAELGSAANIKKTTTIALRFENQQSLADALTLDHKYKAVITFVGTADAGGTNSTLSTTEIPFTLSIPTIDKLFTEQAGVFVGGVANAYMDEAAVSGRSVGATYPFASAFNNFGDNMKATTFTFTLDDETKIVDDLTSADLATINDATNPDADITLNNTLGGTNLVDDNTGLQKGYKQELIVNVSAKFAGVWDYGTANDVDYSFKIKVMSPLYEGTIVATDQIVTIPATDVNGHEVNSSDIAGYTYNNILYSIFPDTSAGLGYKRDEIQKVEFESMDENVFTSDTNAKAYTPANPVTETPAKDGYLVVYPKNLAETTDAKLKVTLTDAWGYKKVAEIPVRVTVGE